MLALKTGGRIFQSRVLLAVLSRYSSKSVVKIFTSVSETRPCQAYLSIPHKKQAFIDFYVSS